MTNKIARSNSPIETAGVKTLRDMIAFLYMPPLDKKSIISAIFFFIVCFQVFLMVNNRLILWVIKQNNIEMKSIVQRS